LTKKSADLQEAAQGKEARFVWVYLMLFFCLEQFRTDRASSINKVNLYVSSSSNTGSIGDDLYCTSRKNSLELP
jgi:hypothetical protein